MVQQAQQVQVRDARQIVDAFAKMGISVSALSSQGQRFASALCDALYWLSQKGRVELRADARGAK